MATENTCTFDDCFFSRTTILLFREKLRWHFAGEATLLMSARPTVDHSSWVSRCDHHIYFLVEERFI